MPPRPLRPKDIASLSEGGEATGSGEGKGGKRKAISSACIPCRKRKSKCDGQLPSCSTCIAVYRTECSYDPDSDFRRKGALKREVHSLQQQNDALDVIVANLKALPDTEALSLLQTLRNNVDLDAIAESLRSNVGLPDNFATQTLEADFAQQLATPTNTNYDPSTLRPSISRQISHDGSVSLHYSDSNASEPPVSWFRIPQDAEFVEHLLSLYFCWVHPFYTFLSWDHFMHDMGRGRQDFCSAMLVNALLSFACHYSDRPAARANPSDPHSAGDHFYAVAKRLLEESDTPCLTTVQALGIMSIRETSAGRDSNGYQLAGRCVRMALELGLHLSVIRQNLRQPDADVRKIAFWGVFNLETICAVSFGRLSQLPRSAADIELTSGNARSDLQTWRPYEDTNLSMSPNAEQLARFSQFREQMSKLSELASDMVNTFYAPKERFTSRRLAATYARYREWIDNLPDSFRLENTSLPHVLVLHMYYHGCVLHLFRPYIKYDLHAADLFPRDACTHSANEISTLMNGLRAMYGLRRVSLAVVNLLLSASTIHLLNLPSEPAATNLSQGIHDLEAMSTNHRFAARAVEIIHSLSVKWNITLPQSVATVAVYRHLSADSISPPPTSTFFAASIPRKGSSEGRDRGGEGVMESPFAPPAQTHQQPMPEPMGPPIMNFYSDPATPLDPRQLQNSFWMPFPTQGMPMHSQILVPGAMDFAQMETAQQWPRPAGVEGPPAHEYHGRQASAPGRLHDNLGGMADWNWQ